MILRKREKIESKEVIDLSNKLGVTEEFATILLNRQIENTEEFLQASLSLFHSPELLKDLSKATDILMKKIKEGKKIRIMGDMDVDGITATTICFTGLRECGADVSYDIPDRVTDGYGVNIRMINEAIKDGVDVILTVDNGIAAFEALEYAYSKGLTIIVTDHHDLAFEEINEERHYLVPKAHAIVNPKQNDCSYPFKGICGAMVALKLIMNLYKKENKNKALCYPLLELAAIATVCDVMDLVDENRSVVKYGIKVLNQGSHFLGIRKLLEVNGLEDKNITSFHIGFIIGPSLNSTGRLSTAKRGVELLLERDETRALEIANELKLLNEDRKEKTSKALEKTLEIIEEQNMYDYKVLTIYIPGIHESVCGIVAGRIREEFGKPTLILTDSDEPGLIKGSGRSIPEYNIFEELNQVKYLLTKMGGHPMAAGLTLEKAKYEELKEVLNEKSTLVEEDFEKKYDVDLELSLHMVTEKFINELNLLEPFGKGNPKPVIVEKIFI